MLVITRRESDWWTPRKGFVKMELISNILLQCLFADSILRTIDHMNSSSTDDRLSVSKVCICHLAASAALP